MEGPSQAATLSAMDLVLQLTVLMLTVYCPHIKGIPV